MKMKLKRDQFSFQAARAVSRKFRFPKYYLRQKKREGYVAQIKMQAIE